MRNPGEAAHVSRCRPPLRNGAAHHNRVNRPLLPTPWGHFHILLQALILFRQIADGFRNADLRQHLAALSGRDRPQSAAAPSPTSVPAAAAPASSNASPTASAIAPLTSACALPCPCARLQRARRPNRHNNRASPPCRTKLDTFTPSGVHQAGLERRTPA